MKMSSAGFLSPCLVACALILSVACKPKQTVVAEDQSVFGELALARGEDVCFDDFELFDEFINAGVTEIEVDTLNSLIQSVEKVPCHPQISALLNGSSQDIALTNNNENSLGLINVKYALKMALRIEKLAPRLRVASSRGVSAVLNIVRRSEEGVHSNAKLLRFWRQIPSVKGAALREVDGKFIDWVTQQHADNAVKFTQWFNKNARKKGLLGGERVVDFLVINADRFKINSKDPLVQQGIKEIFKLMSSPKSIFSHLQELEMDVAKRMAKGEKLEAALNSVLAAQEKLHEFSPAIDLKGDLTRTYFTKANPSLFRDLFFETGSTHGRQIHRIQWYVVTKHIEQTGIDVKGVRLFSAFGEGVVRQGTTGWATGWNALFDSGDFNFGSPNYWRLRFTEYLPVLGRWP